MLIPDTKILLLYGLATAVLISWFGHRKKSAVPAVVGSQGLISSYVAALHFLYNATDVINQGYREYRNGVFLVPTLLRWDYVANGRKRIEEVASAPEHVLSLEESVADNLATDYTVGEQITKNPYHVLVVRGPLTRNLSRCFPAVWDEIVDAFDHVLGPVDKEWQLIQVLPTAVQVVARTSNRLFVGLPLCRELEYLQLNIDYAFAVFVRGLMINLLPGFVKPIFGPLLSTRKSSLRHALKFLGPLIDERLAKENEHGRDWPDRPNDLISWLLDFAEGAERTTPALALRVLFVNMSAIHTSSTAIAAALYDLVVHPEYILSMREEVECVVAEEGWTKAALGRMHKIDSFLRESQRLNNNGPITLPRIVVAKDGFTFSDGTTIPHGSFLSVAATVHFDPANYDRADVFDGFRFSRMREEFEGVGNDHPGERIGVFNRQMVSTAHDHLPFGHGCHVCPGRFFAAMELKAMLAHILVSYDVKAETEGVRPPDLCFGLLRMPNAKGKIWIRKRQ
ncbi:cytochrome P450 [Mycena olivaceomarginata]|nr:cytochrome P450 [Mycena olivaceomarginata]